MQKARRHGAFVCVHQTNATVHAFAFRAGSCEDHPACKRVRDCERGVEAQSEKGLIPAKMATPWLTDAGAGRRLRWSLDIVERCSDQWAEAAMVGCKKSVLQS